MLPRGAAGEWTPRLLTALPDWLRVGSAGRTRLRQSTPFGRTLVQSPTRHRSLSVIGNILWFVLAG